MANGESKNVDPVQAIVDAMPTGTALRVFDNARYFGVEVRFSEKGFGFGSVTLAVNKETGEASFDDECMGVELCSKFVMRTVGTTVVDGNTEEPPEFAIVIGGPDEKR